jgi:UDP-N-acetylglucosamine 2-epimerase (non-hydrolysing)
VPDRYVLATIHRPENTDDSATLRQILEALSGLVERVPVLVALHPRTRDAIARVGAASLLSRLIVTGPLDAGTFLSLAAHAAVIVSDSGGLAEEVTVLKRPLVIVRHSTERAESIRAGFAILVRPDQIEQAAASALESGDALLGRLSVTPSPYGDGSASKRIAALTEVLITAGNSSRV